MAKGLSIWQPWAELIVRGQKDVENRMWPTAYRGPLLIHASKGFDEGAYDAMRDHYLLPPADRLARGALIGVVELVRCAHYNTVAASRRSAWHNDQCFGFYLENARRFETPVPCRGFPGVFDVPDALLSGVVV